MHAEIAMKPVLEIRGFRLPVRSIHRLERAKGQQITCLDGVVWVTQADDNRDIILSKVQSFVVDRKGLAVIFALKEAAIAIGPAGHIAAAAFDPAVVQGIAA